MATVKKKPAPKKKAAVKKAAPAPAEKAVDVAIETAAPEQEQAVTMTAVQELVAQEIGKATQEIIKAVTAASPQVMLDAPVPVVEGDDFVDLELLDLADPIGAQLAREDIASGPTPGGRVVEAELLESFTLTPAQIESMTDDEIAAYNQNEVRKMRARKQAQVVNRSEMANMTPAERVKAMNGKRDPDYVREADNPLGERMVKCQTVRKIGLGEQGTSDLGETVKIPLSGARQLQDSGAIKVLI